MGSETTRLVVLRGNSGSGKSTVADQLRDRFGRGLAIVAQDNIRRTVLREKDLPGGSNIGLIDTVARYALDHGYHVVVEGMLYADRYADMLNALRRDHRGRSHFYYFDIPFEETLRRHATRPLAGEVGADAMREWYRPLDLLPGGDELIVDAVSGLAETVERLMAETTLADAPSTYR